jgi:hypothetical protein
VYPPVPGGTPAAAAAGGRPCPWVDGASAPPSPSSKLKDIRRFRFTERGVGAAAGAMWGGGFMDRGRPLATEEWVIGVGGGAQGHTHDDHHMHNRPSLMQEVIRIGLHSLISEPQLLWGDTVHARVCW